MSCPTGVFLLHALQQLKLDLSVEELSMLYTSCVLQVPQPSQRGVACETIVSGSSSMALYARNAHITIYEVTTWSWVNLKNPMPSDESAYFPTPYVDNQLLCGPKRSYAFNSAGFKHNDQV